MTILCSGKSDILNCGKWSTEVQLGTSPTSTIEPFWKNSQRLFYRYYFHKKLFDTALKVPQGKWSWKKRSRKMCGLFDVDRKKQQHLNFLKIMIFRKSWNIRNMVRLIVSRKWKCESIHCLWRFSSLQKLI